MTRARRTSSVTRRGTPTTNVAIGLKVHSGWAALVVVGRRGDDIVVADRRRIELVAEEWERQPYHAADGLPAAAARDLVRRAVASAKRIAVRELRETVKRERERGNHVTRCAVLTAGGMPPWSVEEILAVHFRMHKAEGVHFRDALTHAAAACGLETVTVPEKTLAAYAAAALATPAGVLTRRIASLGKSVGPPWARDQKDAALAALVALHGRSH